MAQQSPRLTTLAYWTTLLRMENIHQFNSTAVIAIAIVASILLAFWFIGRLLPGDPKRPARTAEELSLTLQNNSILREQLRRTEARNDSIAAELEKQKQKARHFENEFDKIRDSLGEVYDIIQEFVGEDDDEPDDEWPRGPSTNQPTKREQLLQGCTTATTTPFQNRGGPL